jgi:hypothetical protein
MADLLKLFVQPRSEDLGIVLPSGTKKTKRETEQTRRTNPTNSEDVKNDNGREPDDVEDYAEDQPHKKEWQPN